MKQFLIGAIIALLSATGYICYINFFPTTYTCTLTTEANRSTDLPPGLDTTVS